MAAVTFRDHLPAFTSVVSLDRLGLKIGNAALNMIEAFSAGRRRLQTRHALSALTDAQLEDIGVNRAEISSM